MFTKATLAALILLSISACSNSSSSKKSDSGNNNQNNPQGQDDQFNLEDYKTCSANGYILNGIYESDNYSCESENQPATCHAIMNFDNSHCTLNFQMDIFQDNQQPMHVSQNYHYGININKQMLAFFVNEKNYSTATYSDVSVNENTKTVLNFVLFAGENTYIHIHKR